MAHEIELKLRIPSAAAGQGTEEKSTGVLINRLNSMAEAAGIRGLENQYFDTPTFALLKARAALRIRRKGTEYEQTLKTRGRSVAGLQVRNEWNWTLPEAALDTSLLLCDEVQACWPEQADTSALQPVFSTDFQRQVWIWQQGDNRVELVLDQGSVKAAGKSQPLCELEMELLAGEPGCLWSLLATLQADVPLWLSDVSKAERGYRLAGVQPQWQHSVDPALADIEKVSVALTALQRQTEAVLWDDAAVDSLQQAVRALEEVTEDVEIRDLLRTFEQASVTAADAHNRSAARALGALSAAVWQRLSATLAASSGM